MQSKPNDSEKKRGRPSKFTPEIAEEICNRLSTGEPLASICRDEGMPEVRTVSDWKTAHPTFSTDFARSREDGFDALAAQALRIADTPQEGVIIEDSEDGHKERREDMLGHRKLQVETRLKLLAKWCPKRYGDKVGVELGTTDDVSDFLALIRSGKQNES